MKHKYLVTFYRNCASWVATTHRPATLSTKFIKTFNEYYTKMIDKSIENNKYIDHPLTKDRIKKMCEHFVLSKFPLQGEFLIYAYESLEEPENITDEMLQQAYCLACVSETFQSYYLIQDDVYDNSKMRSGVSSWHLQPGASAMAMNDTCILRSFVSEILRQNIKETFYTKVIDTFNENDFTECFDVGESMSKKSTNDIENNKLSWTAVVALQHFNTEQRNIFNECYGIPNPEKIKRIIQLYEEVNLRQLFKEEENARYNNFLRKVQNLPATATPAPDFFMKIFNYFKSYASDSSRFYYA
ncbi:unnamed protein product [Parnassius apollo]|uniref:(apollo) hypothetical protein n=1 Tax=Parnassius apollo TaxID=110799 RepID=A0A8S3Y447_PARAO|nr:unnamed protein product [Parnassius apollo]